MDSALPIPVDRPLMLLCVVVEYQTMCFSSIHIPDMRSVDAVTLHFLLYRAVIGEVDEELDSEINLADIRAEPLNAVVH